MEQKRNVGVHCRQNLLTSRVYWELEFLRTIDICPENSLSGKERPQVLTGRPRREASSGASAGGRPSWICLIATRSPQWPSVSCYLPPDDKVLGDILTSLGSALSLSVFTQARPAHFPFRFVYFRMTLGKVASEISKRIEPDIS